MGDVAVTKIVLELLSDEYLDKIRREAAAGQTALSGEQEVIRVRNLLGHIAVLEQSVCDDGKALQEINRLNLKLAEPIPMRLLCPSCNALHIDEGEFATRAHHTHACQHCGNVWRPAVVATVGVRFLPGFKNEASP